MALAAAGLATALLLWRGHSLLLAALAGAAAWLLVGRFT